MGVMVVVDVVVAVMVVAEAATDEAVVEEDMVAANEAIAVVVEVDMVVAVEDIKLSWTDRSVRAPIHETMYTSTPVAEFPSNTCANRINTATSERALASV